MGCGAGRTTISLYKIGYTDIIGLDKFCQLIKLAKKYCKKNTLPIEFILGDACKLPFLDCSYDTVFFSFNGLMTIRKLENRKKVFEEISRVLKPQGLFIFTAHSYYEKERYLICESQNSFKPGKKLEEGDYLNHNKQFIHIAKDIEIIECLKNYNFKLVEKIERNNICKENENVSLFSDNTAFWIAQKK